MKRGLFIIYSDLKNSGGVNIKIHNQICTMNDNGLKVDTLLMKPNYICGYKILYRMPFTNIVPNWKYDETLKKYDFIYLRRPYFMNCFFLIFLKNVKKNNHNTKVVMEIPTYPYDKEIIKKRTNYTLLIKDMITRKRINRYVDRITVVGNEKEIFGVKTIKILNGYNVIETRKRKPRAEIKSINLVAAAMFDYWHGYDRLIHGLREYYDKGGEQEITLFFVGEGPEKNKYMKLVNDLCLHEHIQFLGLLEKAKILEVYDNSDFGVCSLGAYRKDLFYSCELKSREYLAVGLPIITGVRLDVMDNDKLNKYILEFPNDDSVIDFDEIIGFYEKLYVHNDSSVSMIQEIRECAENELNMSKALSGLIEYLREA